MKKIIVARAALIGAVLLVATPSLAAEGAGSGDPAAMFGGAVLVSDSDLLRIAGQADVNMEVRANNTSNVAHNSVSGNSVTGAIGFDSQSFQDLNGLAVVSANTGNNVSINSSLNVNVALNP